MQIATRTYIFAKKISARRGSNPRPSPWQGDAPPLSHSRIITCVTHNASKTIPHCYFSVNIFINSFLHIFIFFINPGICNFWLFDMYLPAFYNMKYEEKRKNYHNIFSSFSYDSTCADSFACA